MLMLAKLMESPKALKRLCYGHIHATRSTLAVFAREGSGVTAGAIYAVLAYVWTYGTNVNELPTAVQKLLRLKDIASRLG